MCVPSAGSAAFPSMCWEQALVMAPSKEPLKEVFPENPGNHDNRMNQHLTICVVMASTNFQVWGPLVGCSARALTMCFSRC